MPFRVVGPSLAAVLLVGCTADGAFECRAPSDCAAGASAGTCESTGYCSFPDPACASGRRYGQHAPHDVAGTCVPEDVADTGGSESADDRGVSEAGPTSLTGDPTGDPTSDPTLDPSDTTSAVDETSSASSIDPTGLDTSVTTSGSDDTTGGSEPFEVEVLATIAVCTEPMLFDPVHCALEAGEAQFTIDLSDVDGNVSNGWIRFDLGDEIAGAQILSIDLAITVGPDTDDGGPQTGVLWRTAAFDLQSLQAGDPEPLDELADDLGMVVMGDEVSWSLPVDVVDDGAVFLALLPTATNGVDYWGSGSDTPPRLTIVAQ